MKYTYLTYTKNNQTYKCIKYGETGYWCIPKDDRPFFIPMHLINQGICKIEKEVEDPNSDWDIYEKASDLYDAINKPVDQELVDKYKKFYNFEEKK